MSHQVFKLAFLSQVAPTCLALLLIPACKDEEDSPPNEPGEIDPNAHPSLESFEPGPVSEEVLENLRQAACVNVVAAPETPKPSLQFVIDVSGSMALTPKDGDESKWVLTREALRDTVTLLPEEASLGVVYFPNKGTSRNCLEPDGACEPGDPQPIDSCVKTSGALPHGRWGAENSEHRLAFEDALVRVNTAGGTPTHDALLFGLEQLQNAESEGQRVIVLLTDGQPTYLEGCRGSGNVADPVDPTPIIDSIAEAALDGIATFVVGVPGSEETSGGGEDARQWLSDAARAGMTAPKNCEASEAGFCHFDLTEGENFADALDDALSGILAQTKSCDFPLPEPPGEQPIDPDEINVLLLFDDGEGFVVGQGEDNCQEGYILEESDDGRIVHLCPETCDQYREELNIDLELILGCESAPSPPPT